MPQTASSQDSVRLPRAVRERSARIAAMLEPQDSPLEPDATPPANAAPIVVDEPVIDPPADPPQPPADPRHSDPKYWEHRFRVTQGLLESERRDRLAEQERHREEVAQLHEQVRSAQTENAPPAQVDISQFFTAEQIEQYGQEQCETMTRVAIQAAREQTQAAIEAEMKPIREQRQQEEQDRKAQAKRSFTDKLAEMVPDYAEIDADPEWQHWLSQKDPATRLVRQHMLNAYVADRDAEGTAELFKKWKQEHQPAPIAPPVAPRGRGGPPEGLPPATPAAGYPTDAEIRAHFKAAKLGKVTDEERAEFEKRMQLPRPRARAQG